MGLEGQMDKHRLEGPLLRSPRPTGYGSQAESLDWCPMKTWKGSKLKVHTPKAAAGPVATPADAGQCGQLPLSTPVQTAGPRRAGLH